MSTICKLNRTTVRAERSIRKAVRRQVSAIAQAFYMTGDTKGFITYSALHALLQRTTNHRKFLAHLERAGQQGMTNELA